MLGRTSQILLSEKIPLKALWQHTKHICWFQHTSCKMFCCLLAEPAWIHCRDQPEGAPWGSLSASCQEAGLPSYKWEEMEIEEAEMQKEYCNWITNLLLPTVTEPFSYPPNQQPQKTGIDETTVDTHTEIKIIITVSYPGNKQVCLLSSCFTDK